MSPTKGQMMLDAQARNSTDLIRQTRKATTQMKALGPAHRTYHRDNSNERTPERLESSPFEKVAGASHEGITAARKNSNDYEVQVEPSVATMDKVYLNGGERSRMDNQ